MKSRVVKVASCCGSPLIERAIEQTDIRQRDAILDYNEFDLDHRWFPFHWAFRRFGCELASEFLPLDLKGMLARQEFGSFARHLFLRGYVRLLGAETLERGGER